MLKTVLTFCLSFVLITGCFGQQNDSSQEKVVFKTNTEFSVQLETPVNSEKSNVGDDVSFILAEDIIGDGGKILKGSAILGRIVKIEKISAQNDTTRVCIMFDFVKNGTDFVELIATIVAIAPNPEAIKLTTSSTFTSGTTFSLKSKEIQLEKGRVFRVKLTKDLVSNKTS